MKARTHYLKSLKAANRKRHTYEEKRAWVLALLDKKLEASKRTHIPPQRPRVCAMEPDDQEAWESAFGGKVAIYTLGPNVSPDFARTLRRMWMGGDLLRLVSGNQEARNYCQKTYSISYTIKTWPLRD